MKTNLNVAFLTALLFWALRGAVLAAEEPAVASSPVPSREEAVLVSITASVEAIDYTNREVTLKGPLGNTATFTVDQRVKRFKEIQPGDLVHADYYVSLAAELRKPTAEEQENPLVLLDAAGKAPPGTSPAAGGLRRFKAVTTIEGLDLSTQTVTVKGPRGNSLTARVKDPSQLANMKLGDNIVVTYTEAIAISVEKAAQKSGD